ncbi:MAG TPA: hypothetical protein VFD43_08240, partial [Planctomycetota bacterium]|nr:hypothetical protein [Planctomycetota bacterium]
MSVQSRLSSQLTRVSVVALLLVAVAALAAPSAPAQCFGPDNLVGPCCAPATPNLPPLPGVTLPGLGICWSGCNVASQNGLTVVWAPPLQPFCSEYVTPLTVIDSGSGTTILTGTLILDYTRTWDEIDPSGLPTQVWRFTAKADLSAPVGGTATLCPKPTCITPFGPHPTAFYYGYVDYASCAATGPFSNVLVLFHNCDRFIHQPGLSDRPGVFHPGSTYAIVAPHSPLQPFVPALQIASGLPVMGEATRRMDTTSLPPTVCYAEDRVAQSALTLLGAGCLNVMLANPKQQTLRDFRGVTGCINAAGLPGQWLTLNVNFPVLPWFHMVSTSIGRWTNPAVYPGPEHAWADEGLFIHREACTAMFVDLKYGASTYGGWGAFTSVGPVKGFTDIADNYSAPAGGPYPTPILGSVRPTDRLIYVNQ